MSSPFPASSHSRLGSPCSDDSNDVPEMTSASSLQSFPESDSDSLSSASGGRPSTRAPIPASSPRSIFKRYWSSPRRIKDLEAGDDDDDDAIVARLRMLRLLLTVDDEDSVVAADETALAPIERENEKSRDDDDPVDDRRRVAPTPETTDGPTGAPPPRRRILPTPPPPPPTAASSSLIRPWRRLDLLPARPLESVGKSRSASALLERERRGPLRSCLRRSRYSCSAIAAAATAGVPDGGFDAPRPPAASCHDRRGGLKKSVSFQSRVSVLEFAVPREEEQQQRGREGWSEIFS